MVDTFGGPIAERAAPLTALECRSEAGDLPGDARTGGVGGAGGAAAFAERKSIFKWLQDARFAPGGMLAAAPLFLPVQLRDDEAPRPATELPTDGSLAD